MDENKAICLSHHWHDDSFGALKKGKVTSTCCKCGAVSAGCSESLNGYDKAAITKLWGQWGGRTG